MCISLGILFEFALIFECLDFYKMTGTGTPSYFFIFFFIFYFFIIIFLL